MNRKEEKSNRKKALKRALKSHWQLYILILPFVVYLAIFNYGPLYGVLMAFKNYKPYLGVFGSGWVGLQNFERFFTSNAFATVVPNTIILSLYTLIAGILPPIILALCLHYIPSVRFKKIVQNITYAPHFLSMVVLVSIINVLFTTDNGLINNIIEFFGGESVFFLADEDMFRPLYVWSGVWQNVGWGSIMYLASLTNVSPELHEVARVDGASIWQRIRYIDWPAIKPVMMTLLILNMGKVMSVGFEKAFMMQNTFNISKSELISTYEYSIGMMRAQYSYSAAIGLFNTIVNVILVVISNTISKKVSDTSLY